MFFSFTSSSAASTVDESWKDFNGILIASSEFLVYSFFMLGVSINFSGSGSSMFVWSAALRGLDVGFSSALGTWTEEDEPLTSAAPNDMVYGDSFFEGSEGSSDSYSYS